MPSFFVNNEETDLQLLRDAARRYRDNEVTDKLRPSVVKKLLNLGVDWKAKQPNLKGNEFVSELSKAEVETLLTAGSYTLFASFLLKNPKLVEKFFILSCFSQLSLNFQNKLTLP